MAQSIDKVYEEAIASRLIPGFSLLAGDKDGNILYSKSLGSATTNPGRDLPFTDNTVCLIASMTKLMTSVAALQCVEDGTLELDKDVRPLLPEMGKYGIITGFDENKNAPTLSPNSTPITLRMLLSHTSGHEYDWLSPLLGKWRESRNEELWSGPTIEDKSAIPLVFEPGTGFAYGAGHDWTAKLIQIASGKTLEEFMRERIWTPLGVDNDTSFWPKTKESMRDRIADLTMSDGNGALFDASAVDLMFGATDCIGGGGVYASPTAFYTFLSAVLRRDPKLLSSSSYTELFHPQLDERCEQRLNDYIALSPLHTDYLGLRIPHSVRKSWSFAGLVAKDRLEGRFERGTTLWAGAATTLWFIDHEAGICGTAFCQILPPMHPPVVALHEQFQRGVFEEAKR
ncbi:beta-lactamase/transpeptidase-like protein [Hypoxylon sp. FL1150]|nr:beta-lactamase/transpeptidase-like protein [Hypoxylon sp. FL1150]